MYPEFQIGTWIVRSYGAVLVVAFLAGLFVSRYRARRAGIEAGHVIGHAFWAGLATPVGAWLAFAVINYHQFRDDFSSIQATLWELQGMVLYGGLIGGSIATWLFAWFHRLPLLKFGDVLAPSLALGICLTRIGCFLNGCCFGLPTDLPWGVLFPASCTAGEYQRQALDLPAIHPTQIYSSLCGLLTLVVLLVLERSRKRFDGFSVFTMLLLYSGARFFVDFFRYYEDQYHGWFGLTLNQYLSVAVFVFSSLSLALLSSRHDRSE